MTAGEQITTAKEALAQSITELVKDFNEEYGIPVKDICLTYPGYWETHHGCAFYKDTPQVNLTLRRL